MVWSVSTWLDMCTFLCSFGGLCSLQTEGPKEMANKNTYMQNECPLVYLLLILGAAKFLWTVHYQPFAYIYS